MDLITEKSPRSHVWIWLGISIAIKLSTGGMIYSPFIIPIELIFTMYRFLTVILPVNTAMVLVEIILIDTLIFLSMFIIGIRRLNDLNRNPWWILMMFIPLLDIALLLALLFRPPVITAKLSETSI